MRSNRLSGQGVRSIEFRLYSNLKILKFYGYYNTSRRAAQWDFRVIFWLEAGFTVKFELFWAGGI